MDIFYQKWKRPAECSGAGLSIDSVLWPSRLAASRPCGDSTRHRGKYELKNGDETADCGHESAAEEQDVVLPAANPEQQGVAEDERRDRTENDLPYERGVWYPVSIRGQPRPPELGCHAKHKRENYYHETNCSKYILDDRHGALPFSGQRPVWVFNVLFALSGFLGLLA